MLACWNALFQLEMRHNIKNFNFIFLDIRTFLVNSQKSFEKILSELFIKINLSYVEIICLSVIGKKHLNFYEHYQFMAPTC